MDKLGYSLNLKSIKFSPTHSTLWAGTNFFSSRRVRHWLTESTTSVLDTPHTSVQHLHKKFYCRIASSQGGTVTANLQLGVLTPEGMITLILHCRYFIYYYASHQLVYRAALKLLHPCVSLASLWMVPQLWFIFFISASTVLHQVVFWGPVDCNFGDGVGILVQHMPNPAPSLPERSRWQPLCH